MAIIKKASHLASKAAKQPGYGHDFATFVRGQGYAPADAPARQMAGLWIAWGWIGLDPTPRDLSSKLRGLDLADGDVEALRWLAEQAGDDVEAFVLAAEKAAKAHWIEHWAGVVAEAERERALDDECEDDEGEDDDRTSLVQAVEQLIEASGATRFATGSTDYDADGLRDWARECEAEGDHGDYYADECGIVAVKDDGYLESVGLVRPVGYSITVDKDGNAVDLHGELPELAAKLAELGYEGPSVAVRDAQGSVRGWVSAGSWRA